MGKISSFTVSFSKSIATYYVGEKITGKIHVTVAERFRIQEINLSIKGDSYVQWSELVSNKASTDDANAKNNKVSGGYKENNTNNETYIFTTVKILSKTTNDLYLEVGNFSYPFSFELPKALPTSFEHTNGSIRYYVSAKIEVPWSTDYHSIRSFTVISKNNLNDKPELKQSHGVSDAQTFCWGPCKTEPIIAKFGIKKMGYVCGEAIYFDVSIDNKTKKQIKEMKVSLIQVIKLKASGKVKTSMRAVALLKNTKTVHQLSSTSWASQLFIPPVCASSTGLSKIVDISYLALFNYVTDDSDTAFLKIPVEIGTIPMNEGNKFKYSHEISPFDSTNIRPMSDLKGEVIENDKNTFKPYYPFYKSE